jgi:phosphatidylglycerol lysyltransferase
MLPPGSATLLAAELKAVSDAWLADHNSAEKGFSMGRFDLAYLDRGPLGLVRRDGHLIAFANVLTGRAEAGIDLMRYVPGAPAGIMDFLFVRLIEWARDNDYAAFNLGMAPLSGLQNRRMAPVFARLGALVFAEAGRLYSFGGLHAYKDKFFPEWQPRYMAGRPGVFMPMALLDVALLTGGGWRGLFFRG